MPSLAFIGAGNMAEAIARGLLRTAAHAPADLAAIDPNPDRQKLFRETLGIPCTAGFDALTRAKIIILAVKPFIVADVLAEIKNSFPADALLISIAAGISCRFIEERLTSPALPQPRIIRVMPNTPMLAGKGISALCRGSFASEDDLSAAERIFSAGGKTVRVSENQMDAVTALSGSGPAYVFYFTDCLAKAGVAAGLSESDSSHLARQTVIGAAALLEQSPDSPAELQRKVTTPGGTTQAAIEALQAGALDALIKNALAAAAKRSRELGK